jgi:hypothetical protein
MSWVCFLLLQVQPDSCSPASRHLLHVKETCTIAFWGGIQLFPSGKQGEQACEVQTQNLANSQCHLCYHILAGSQDLMNLLEMLRVIPLGLWVMQSGGKGIDWDEKNSKLKDDVPDKSA